MNNEYLSSIKDELAFARWHMRALTLQAKDIKTWSPERCKFWLLEYAEQAEGAFRIMDEEERFRQELLTGSGSQ